MASVAVTVNKNGPVTVGVPEIRPAVDKVKLVGNAPALIVNVRGAVPPVPVICCEYAIVAVAAGNAPATGLSVTVPHTMLIEYAWLPVHPLTSVALTVKANGPPTTVGVPESNPPVDKVKPPGSAPERILNVTEPIPPVCVMFWL